MTTGRDWEAIWKPVGGELGTAGMWMELRGVPAECGIIEVARELSFLDHRDCSMVRREL